jgi:hypothetical protein
MPQTKHRLRPPPPESIVQQSPRAVSDSVWGAPDQHQRGLDLLVELREIHMIDVVERPQQVRTLDVKVHVHHRLIERNQWVDARCTRSDQSAFLAVPERDDHRPFTGYQGRCGREVSRCQERCSDACSVIGSTVADVVVGKSKSEAIGPLVSDSRAKPWPGQRRRCFAAARRLDGDGRLLP